MRLLPFLALLAVAVPTVRADEPETPPAGPAVAEPPSAVPEAPAHVDSPAEIRVRPAMPRDAPLPPEAFGGRPRVSCIVRLSIDENGVPYEAVPKACEAAIATLARDVALRHRFYPVKSGAKRVKAEFDLSLTFANPHAETTPAAK